MPELPEVETITNALRPHLLNKRISSIIVSDKTLRFPLDMRQLKTVDDCKITNVKRRAKYILIELDNLSMIVIHLGMSGFIRIENRTCKQQNHDHFFLYLKNNTVLIFNDMRRFGSVRIFTIKQADQLPEFFDKLPPEPLSNAFNSKYLSTILKHRSKSIKSILMDNKLITGVGNIYASEALFLANINPDKSGAHLSKNQRNNLTDAIKTVLKESIKSEGTTISDYKKVDGTEGQYYLKLSVYGKEQQQCINKCGCTIKRTKIGNRSTFYCPECQKN